MWDHRLPPPAHAPAHQPGWRRGAPINVGTINLRRTTHAGWLLVVGARAGIPLGIALSQTAPRMHTETLLQQQVSGIPSPLAFRCVTLAGSLAPRPAPTSTPVP